MLDGRFFCRLRGLRGGKVDFSGVPDELTRSSVGLEGLEGFEEVKNEGGRPFLSVAGALSGVPSSMGVRALSAGLKMLRLFLRFLSDIVFEVIEGAECLAILHVSANQRSRICGLTPPFAVHMLGSDQDLAQGI